MVTPRRRPSRPPCKGSLADITDDPDVERVVTYADAPAPALLSNDGASTLAVVYLNKEVESAVEDSARLADAVDAPAGVEVQVTGIPQLYHEFNQKIEQDLVMAETISLPIALLILLAVFGTLVAAGLPLLIAALAMPTVVRRHRPAGVGDGDEHLRHQPGDHDRPGAGDRLLAVHGQPLPRGAAPSLGRRSPSSG